MENKEFYIDKDGFKIHAKLDFPECHGDKLPLLILVHGLTGHMEERHIIAEKDAALECGYACLRTDMYGHGKSDGEFRNHNVLEWVLELMHIVTYASELDFVSDIVLSGHSQGGLTVMLTAPLVKDKIKAIMPMAPAIIIKDASLSGNLLGVKFDPVNMPDEINLGLKGKLSTNYFRIGRALPIEEAIDSFDKPVCLIHGTADQLVPVKYGTDAVARYKNAEFVPVEDDLHCFDYHLDKAMEAVRDFLLKVN